MMDYNKERKHIISSAKQALKQLDKLITQNIELEELDPEKAKAAAQGKIEAIEGSFKILNLISEQEELMLEPSSKKAEVNFMGVEKHVR